MLRRPFEVVMKLGLFFASLLMAFTAYACTAQSGGTNTQPEVQSTTSTILETNDRNFEHDVIDSNKPVLVDFYASWCAPCKRMEPVLEDLATMYRGKVKILRVDVEKNPEVASRYRIRAIPHIMLFKDGDLVDDVLGMTSRERLSYSVERTL